MEIMACPTACDSPGKQLESNDVVIDVPLVMEPALWPGCCIYRVPKELREVNGKAYTPKFVSIGPFHHGQKELRDMEMYKLRYFKDFLYRTKKCQEDFRNIIAENEVQIRHCYSEDCGLESDGFVKMILLDAIFIIEVFLKVTDKDKENYKKESDYILSQPWLEFGILHDLILLENQLPFFVLEELYRFAFGDSSSCNNREEIKEHKEDLKKEDSPLFVKLSRNYFGSLSHLQEGQQIIEHKKDTPFVELSRKYFGCCYEDKEPNTLDAIIDKEVKHLTDLLRYLYLPSNMKDWISIERSSDTRLCATKLDDAGLKFKVKRDHRLLDISVDVCFGVSCCIACLPCIICLICFPCLFRIQRRLKVQQLVIDDNTETIFRNLMALEQCHYPSQTYVCSYVLLLDRLVDTDKDVDLLVQKKVIVNQLGSNTDVVSLINKLGLQIVEAPSSYFNDIDRTINGHYELTLNRTMATLKREYFPNIFRGTATVVGLVVLGFTLWNFLRPFVI